MNTSYKALMKELCYAINCTRHKVRQAHYFVNNCVAFLLEDLSRILLATETKYVIIAFPKSEVAPMRHDVMYSTHCLLLVNSTRKYGNFQHLM